jgi:multidrug resistance efflux pump
MVAALQIKTQAATRRIRFVLSINHARGNPPRKKKIEKANPPSTPSCVSLREIECLMALVQQRAADQQVKEVQSERRQHLSVIASSAEEQQVYAGTAVQAKAAFDAAQQQLTQAEINLRRTEVRSPVNGYVTNLLMRVTEAVWIAWRRACVPACPMSSMVLQHNPAAFRPSPPNEE